MHTARLALPIVDTECSPQYFHSQSWAAVACWGGNLMHEGTNMATDNTQHEMLLTRALEDVLL